MTPQMTMRAFMRIVERVAAGLDRLEERAKEYAQKTGELEAEAHETKNRSIRLEHDLHALKVAWEDTAKLTHRTIGYYYQLKNGLQAFLEAHALDPDEPFAEPVTSPPPIPTTEPPTVDPGKKKRT